MVLKKIYKKVNSIQRLFFPSMNHRMRLHYAEHYEDMPIDSDLILYETRDGKSMVDSPLAIFEYLVNNKSYSHFKHVWVVDKKIEGIENMLPKNLESQVYLVYRGTLEYVDALLKAKYLISNSTFESFFVKRTGQVYINTWHGTPLKFMGFDIPGSIAHSQNVLRNFLMTDYLLSPNSHTSNIFINSYKLKDIYNGEILEGGYPRIDFIFNEDKDRISEKLALFGITSRDNKKKILYCPTWKGKNVHQATDEIEQIINETLKLKDYFAEDYDVLVKVHPFVFSAVKNDPRLSGILVSDLIDPNQVLSITDILITDYSSIFFDYLVTGKPIIFYAWDKDLYDFERGMYLTEDELPGPTAENLDELTQLIENVDLSKKEYSSKYEKLAERMTPYEDGKVTKKYVDYIFDGKDSNQLVTHKVNSSKKKILIFPGGMRNNGITSSFLNLTNNIDYDKYDVTVISNPPKGREINSNLKSMNRNIRPLFRFGIDILTRKEKMINKLFANKGVDVKKRADYPDKGYRREMNRLVGNLEFDVAIDFSGYSYFWGRHILGAKAKKYVVFMHNDLFADSRREVNGKMPMYKDLTGLFSIYYKFDKLLSVSPMTRDVNYDNLKKYVEKNQMSYVYNTININKILEPSLLNEEPKSLQISRRILRFKESKVIKYAINIDKVLENEFEEISVQSDSAVMQHAKYSLDDQVYCKVSIDNMYLGWVNEIEFLPKINEIQKIEDFHGFATVSRFLNYPVWKEIKTNTDSDQILTYIRPFANRYLEIEKIAYTDAGRYFLVKYNQKILGWVSPKPLARVHKINKLSPLNSYFLTRMKNMELVSPVKYTDLIESADLFGTIMNVPDIELWSTPKNTTGSDSIPFSDEYYNFAFKINEICHVGSKIFYKLSLPNNVKVGYIDSEFVNQISEEKYNEMQLEINRKEMKDFTLPAVDLGFQKVPKFDSSFYNIVNMGRLSPEKNQRGLIEGFANFRKKFPKSRLYILGKGPLKDDLIQCIKDTQQEGFVFLLGHLSSPFNFIKETNLFVLPSFYEGQPMVLLESMTLGMKILASNIPANINVIGVNETYGLLTNGTSAEDITDGFSRIKDYKGEFEKFDPYEYNEQAIASFYREINVN